jgi:hypothetical protein
MLEKQECHLSHVVAAALWEDAMVSQATETAYPHRDAGASTADTIDDTHTLILNRVSWSGVLAGAAIALVSQLILNMLGVGIGAATIDPASGGSPTAGAFSITAALWWTVSGIVAAFLGGYTAGRLSGQPSAATSGWNGLVSWAVSTLLLVYLLATAIGAVLGGTLSALGSTGRSAMEAASPMLGGDPFGAIAQQLRERMGNQGAQAARDAAIAAVSAAITGDQAQAKDARERAAQALATAQGISVDEARGQVAQYETRYRQAADQAKQRATEAADAASRAASLGGLFGTLALLLGAIAAWFGGRAGSVNAVVTEERQSFGRRPTL